jgi:hypothetical protein
MKLLKYHTYPKLTFYHTRYICTGKTYPYHVVCCITSHLTKITIYYVTPNDNQLVKYHPSYIVSIYLITLNEV